MKPTVLIYFVALLAGCVSPINSQKNSATESTTSNTGYPFSEVAKIYDTVLEGMTAKYFASYPELDKEHTKPMQAFIAAEYSKEKFVKAMVRDKSLPIFERASKDRVFRETKEFKDTLYVVVSVSVSMAKMIIGGERDIYVAKYVEKDPLRAELFAMAEGEDERQYVSWVSGEVSSEEARKECGKEYNPEPGDRVYAFCSPEPTWQDLCGRQGFLVVRNGKIVQVIITLLS